MPPAFSTFDEPHAWLIRGLVEYGWPDISRASGVVPQGAVGGLDLRGMGERDGRDGIILEVPALAGGQRCVEDGSYRFEARVTRGAQGPTITVRCPEANYLQEFPYDPANPLWAAGYIHQALTSYVPQFVQWRLQGGEVSWAERAGMPEIQGEPCSFVLARFVADAVQANRPLHQGPQAGWWLAAAPPPDAGAASATGGGVPASWGGGQVAAAGRGGGDPVYLSAAARDAQANGQPIASVGNVQALARVQKPGTALMALGGLGMVQAFLWFLNGLSVLAFYLDDSAFALVFSLFAAVTLFVGGGLALWGGWKYRKLEGGPLPLVAMAYAVVVPVCCLGGVPVAVWAAMTWRDPMVKRARG